mmetsp:Transcript_3072/g.8535  ORF Transcript_3072/g.8535 Transcript_3072/m.8535 type:complete len:160 (+) Transcript_3072:93-572(+)
MFTSLIVFFALSLATGSKRITPRQASLEELLETADGWLLDYDEDEDEQLSITEMGLLKDFLHATTASPTTSHAALTEELLMQMADGDSDGFATRNELVDLLRRMKDFDGGHMARDAAKLPRSTESVGYGQKHGERLHKKNGRKKARRKARDGTARKDEV